MHPPLCLDLSFPRSWGLRLCPCSPEFPPRAHMSPWAVPSESLQAWATERARVSGDPPDTSRSRHQSGFCQGMLMEASVPLATHSSTVVPAKPWPRSGHRHLPSSVLDTQVVTPSQPSSWFHLPCLHLKCKTSGHQPTPLSSAPTACQPACPNHPTF